MAASGKFIAIEGTDGSGKTVQFERFILALPESMRTGTLDFPQYNEPSAYFVEKYLKGRYGADLSPRTASMLFAMDRFDARLKTIQWLEEGRLVVANRYVASNMAHQGAKIANDADRERFYKWLYEFEYEILGVPKPNLNIVLHVPAEITAALIAKRAATKPRPTTHFLEDDVAYQKRAEHAFLEIAALFPNDFRVIECAPNGKLLSQEEIQAQVFTAAQNFLPR